MTNPPPNSLAPALRTGRLLCLIAVATYALYWVANRYQATPYVDPLAPRLTIVAICVAMLLGTYVSERVRRIFSIFMIAVVYAITAHIFGLLMLNSLDQALVIGVLVVLAGFIATATYTVSTERQLLAYLAFVVLLSLTAVEVVPAPRFPAPLFLLSIGVVLAMTFVSVSVHMRTLNQLVESERLLRTDVLAREAAAAQLRQSEARANALLDAVPDVMLRLRKGGVLVDIRNDESSPLGGQLHDFLGARLDSLLGADSSELAHAVDIALESGEIAKVATDIMADGRRRNLEIRVARTSAEECLALARDVTQEQELDGRLRMAERLASLGTLASGVAHEINNPLSYVIANVDYVHEALEQASEEDLRKLGGEDLLLALREIQEGGRRIGSIVQSLKSQARHEDSPPAPSDVNEAVESALRILDNQLRYRTRVELALGRTPNALCHASRLVQVLVNLLANAIDAFPERSSDQNLVRIETRSESGGLVILVSDNGTGIPDSARARIFDPFFTTKAPGVGTGLGLYLCHQYVTAVGGTIDVESDKSAGTRFRIWLKAAAGGRIGDSEPNVAPLASSRILIVDDEPLVARSLARMLRGHELVLAGDGEAALWECLSRDFDLVLCDLMMPRMDGSAFYAALKDHRPRLASRIVFMTGGAFTAGARDFLERVPNARIEKPIHVDRLFDAARRQLTAAADTERERAAS